MNQPEPLQIDQITEALQTAATQKTSAVMSHLSKGKWHMTRVILKTIDNTNIHVEIAPKDKPHPINIQIDQPVGISFKLGYNKFIFESAVAGFEPSPNAASGGTIVLNRPDRMEKLGRRNYFRVSIPKDLNVKVLFWHRGYLDDSTEMPIENYWQAKLLDISAGGMQILISQDQKPNFKVGQLVGLQFTPMPYEKPILLEGQVRHIAPTLDNANLALGVQIIGLEASDDGREKLHRLCSIVEQYHQMNQTQNTDSRLTPASRPV